MLTLRQIEVIRAIMVTGTVGGAARLLNVSSPGVSRVMKHAETSVGVKLFSRRGGRYSPTPQANAIFSQINGVYDKIEDLQFVISRVQRGAETELKIGSVPSIASIMVPRAIADLRRALPNLPIEVDILKIEDAVDYLLLGKGELGEVAREPSQCSIETRAVADQRFGERVLGLDIAGIELKEIAHDHRRDQISDERSRQHDGIDQSCPTN